MKNILFVLLITTAGALASGVAIAGSQSGKLTNILSNREGYVMFGLQNEHSNRPACSSTEWALALNTYGGRAMYAMLLSAQAQGKTVNVQGAGACGAWGDREEPSYIYLTN